MSDERLSVQSDATSGTVDRKSFFDEQRRQRRISWLAAAVSVPIMFGVALAASFVLSPGIMLGATLLLVGVNQLTPVPDAVREALMLSIDAFSVVRSALITNDREPWRLASALIVLVLPSLMVVFSLWLVIFRHLCTLGRDAMFGPLLPRAPNNVPEERQLQNVVEEIAVAAGVPIPAVMLTDLDFANALVVGTSHTDATLIVSRRLLNELDRDATQGVVAHLIASIGNGDPRITFAIGASAQTIGLLLTMLDVPLSSHARTTVFRWLRMWLPGFSGRAVADQSELGVALTRAASGLDAVSDALSPITSIDHGSGNLIVRGLKWVRFVISLPCVLLSLELKLLIFLFTLFVMGPVYWTILRSRRYLADASAVRLTRQPDGLARALVALVEQPRAVSTLGWCEPLLAVSGLAASGPNVLGGSALETVQKQPRGSANRPRKKSKVPMIYWGAQPPVSARLRRLRELGSMVGIQDSTPRSTMPARVSDPGGDSSSSRSRFRGWSLSNPLRILGVLALVAVAAILVVSFAGFFVYLLGVGVLGAAVVLGGWYVLAFEIVSRLVAWGL